MTPQQQQAMISLSDALYDSTREIIDGARGNAVSLDPASWRAVGRIQGIARGFRAIAKSVCEDDKPRLSPTTPRRCRWCAP